MKVCLFVCLSVSTTYRRTTSTISNKKLFRYGNKWHYTTTAVSEERLQSFLCMNMHPSRHLVLGPHTYTPVAPVSLTGTGLYYMIYMIYMIYMKTIGAA